MPQSKAWRYFILLHLIYLHLSYLECHVYLSLDIKQFVQKFKPILKVAEDLPSYERHIAILVYYIAFI